MRTVVITLLLTLFAGPLAYADGFRVDPYSGSFTQHPGSCGPGFRDTILSVIDRDHPLELVVTPAGVVRRTVPAAESVVTGYGAWAFWRSGSQTLVIALRPKVGTQLRDVDISIIDRSGRVCYEKWHGLAKPINKED